MLSSEDSKNKIFQLVPEDRVGLDVLAYLVGQLIQDNLEDHNFLADLFFLVFPVVRNCQVRPGSQDSQDIPDNLVSRHSQVCPVHQEIPQDPLVL